MKKTFVIVNPNAGGGISPEFIADLASDPMLEVRETDTAGEGRSLAREAVENGFEVVVAAGGDGTVHEVVVGLHDADGSATLAVIPLGTGNDLVRSLELNDRERALRALTHGRTRKLDLIKVTLDGGDPRVAVNAVIAGAGAKLSQDMDEDMKGSWGPLSYLRKAVEMAGEVEPFDVEFSVDGTSTKLEVLNVVVANGRFAGHGVPIAPAADPFDGRLNVAVVRNAPLHQLSRLAPAFFKQEDPEDDLFITGAGRIITLETDRPVPFSIDGEAFTARKGHFEVLPGALKILVDSQNED